MRLGIDLDGVVANFNLGWMELYNAEFGADLTPDLVLTWDAVHELAGFATMQEFWAWARGEDRPSIFRHLPTFEGAVSALRGLAGAHDIVIITTKPGWAVHDTFAWLADNEIPTREVHITPRKHQVSCDVYLEDSPHHLPLLVARRPDSVVCRFVRSWNRPVAGARDVHTWDDFVSIVEETGR